jgi:hypothetical protein
VDIIGKLRIIVFAMNEETKQSAEGVPSAARGSRGITTGSFGALVTWIATLRSQ